MMKGKKKSVLCIALCAVLILQTAIAPMVSHAAEESTAISCDWETVAKSRTNGMAPNLQGVEGKVFAGFYKDNECTEPLKANETQDTYTGEVYAKYVAQEVLSVKCQVATDTTSDSTETDLRLLTTVDTLNYQSAGFQIEIDGIKRILSSRNVYETTYGHDNRDEVVYRANETFASESAYFVTYQLIDLPNNVFGTQIQVTPMWTTLDGIVVTGVERTFSIYEAIGAYQTGIYDPNHNYLEYIQGEEYEFFIKPVDTTGMNRVQWDEEMQAYHLVNKWQTAGNTRGFVFHADYLMNIIEHTDATTLTFEVRNDGVQSGIKNVVSGVYDWIWTGYNTASNKAFYTNVDVSDWNTYTLNLADIPKDENGNIIPFFIMHECQGMYVRNIKLLMEDGSDPNHNYLEAIKGEAYEFFFIPNSTDNTVEWDETKQAFHLKNVHTGAGNGRAFSLDKEYLANIMKYTDAKVLKFQLSNDNELVNNGQQYDYLYQAYDMAWSAYNWTGYPPQISTYEVEINLADMVNSDGTLKAYTIMHARQGMYVSNIKLCRADGSDLNHNYLEAIQGAEYEFFISPNVAENSVEWDETKQAYHLKNLTTGAGNGRAFIFDMEYLANVIKYTDAETLTFEVQNDGALVSNGQKYDYLYQAYDMAWGAYDWTGYHPETRSYTVEINLADIPKNEDGTLKSFTIMHSRQGMYVKNIKFCLPGGYDPSYKGDIQGEAFEFFVKPMDTTGTNTVTWEDKAQAYHLVNHVTGESDSRGFLFEQEYFSSMMKHTESDVLTFEVKSDSTIPELSFWLETRSSAKYKSFSTSDGWTKIAIRTEDILQDEDGKHHTIFLLDDCQDIYIRHIKLEQTQGYNPNHNYLEYIQRAEYEFFVEPLNSQNSVTWNEEQLAYFLTDKAASETGQEGYVFNQEYLTSILYHTDVESISYEVKVGENTDGSAKWETVHISFADIIVDEDGSFESVSLVDEARGTYIRNIQLHLPAAMDVHILKNGVSEYQLLLPTDGNNLIYTAATEFNLFFEEATGEELDIVYSEEAVYGQKYISIGETLPLRMTDISYTLKELGTDGFKIVTEDNNIYLIGGSNYGSLYAVYELLAELVNFDYMYEDTYQLNRGVTNLPLEQYNITEIPDIAFRAAGDSIATKDVKTLYRMRVKTYTDDIIMINGDWVHHSLHLVNGLSYDGTVNTTDATWFNDTKTQLCYTAHGDSEQYEAMLNASLNTLKGRIKADPTRRTFIISSEDNRDSCSCDACTAVVNEYGALSATTLLFANDLKIKLDEWFATEEGKAYAGEFNLPVLAYHDYEAPPMKKQIELEDGIYAFVALIDVDYNVPLTEGNNNPTYYQMIKDWASVTNNQLYIWYYGINFYEYLAPYDNFDSMQKNYQIAKQYGAAYMLDQRQIGETGFVSAWNNLKSYVSYKLMWDVNADVDELINRFFEVYFGDGAVEMRKYFDSFRELSANNLALEGFAGNHSSHIEDIVKAEFWPEAAMLAWMANCDAALEAIADLESTNLEQYRLYKDHIEGEKLVPLYLYIQTTKNNATANIAEFKEIVDRLGMVYYGAGKKVSTLCSSWTFPEQIRGEEYEFFFEPVAPGTNSVEWDEEQQAFHLINKFRLAWNSRGFRFSAEYVTNLMKYTEATGITFEVRNDGVQSGIKDLVSGTYDWIWTGFNTASNKTFYTNVDVCDWQTYTLNFASIPKDEDGNIIPFFLMHECQGMYVRNVRLNIPRDYTAPIQGDEYEFFINPIDTTGVNSVEWDEELQAFHLINKWQTQGNSRGFVLDSKYLENVMEHTGATSISFEVKNDGNLSGSGGYERFWQSYLNGASWVGDQNMYVDANYDWVTITINFEDIPTDSNGDKYPILLLHETKGMYVRNITWNTSQNEK